MGAHSPADLQRIYAERFAANQTYRQRVWTVLVRDFFSRYVGKEDTVLDLGCGYGEFINIAPCRRRLAMDLNPDAPRFLRHDVEFIEQDCSTAWPFEDGALDVVFTSNFFEHLPDKAALGRTLDEIRRCLKPGGRLVAMGPNIRYVPGAYWDFWDHYIPLTDASLKEALMNRGFNVPLAIDRFLPYTMADGREYPIAFLQLYLRLPLAWPFFGKQFLIVGTKP